MDESARSIKPVRQSSTRAANSEIAPPGPGDGVAVADVILYVIINVIDIDIIMIRGVVFGVLGVVAIVTIGRIVVLPCIISMIDISEVVDNSFCDRRGDTALLRCPDYCSLLLV
jgi:hypothetical protein